MGEDNAITMAIKWIDYLISHQKKLHSLGANNGVNGAYLILNHKKDLLEPFTARFIRNKGWNGLDSINIINEAVQCLIDHRYLHTEPVLTTSVGGRPTEKFKWIN